MLSIIQTDSRMGIAGVRRFLMMLLALAMTRDQPVPDQPVQDNDSSGLPTFLELVENWKSWDKKVTSIEPVALIVEEHGSLTNSLGSNLTRSEFHFAKGFYAGAAERELTPEGRKLKTMPFVVIFARFNRHPHFVTLVKETADSNWYVEEVKDALDINDHFRGNTESFRSACLIRPPSDSFDSLMGGTTKLLVLNDRLVVATNDETRSETDAFRRKLLHFEITFSRDQDWLPTEIIATYRFGDGGVGVRKSSYRDWRQWEGLNIPFESEVILDQPTPRLVASTRIRDLRRCSLAEVKQRCSLSYYELPEPSAIGPRPSKNVRIAMYFMLSLATVGVSYWFFHRLRKI